MAFGAVRDLIVRFSSDTTKLKGTAAKVSKEMDGAGKAAEKAGDKAGKGFGGKLGAGVLGAAAKVAGPLAAIFAVDKIVDFGKVSVGLASDLNETVSKSATIFGQQSKAIEQWANGAAKNLGLSKSEALAAAAGFGDMFTQIGFSGKEAAKSSKSVVQMAADLGSFNNLETGDVLDKISGAMRGEYDSLQAVIPNINAARVENEALAATGKKSAKELTAQEKAQATLAIIQKDGAKAMGDFAKTSGGAANQSKIFAAQSADLKAKLGGLLLPIVTKVFTFLNNVALPAVSKLVDSFKSGGKQTGALAGVFAKFAPIVEGVKAVVVGLGKVWSQIFAAIGAVVKEHMPEINGMMSDAGTAFAALGQTMQAIGKALAAVWEKIGPTVIKIIKALVGTIIGVLSGLIKIVSGIFLVLSGIFTGDSTKIKAGVTKIFQGLAKVLGSILGGIVKILKALFGPLVKWFIGQATKIKDGLVATFKAITDWVKGTWGKAWSGIKKVITAPVTGSVALVKTGWKGVTGAFTKAKEWTATTWRKGWSGVKGWISKSVEEGRDRSKTALTGTRNALSNMRDWGKTTWRKSWAGMKAVISDPVGSARTAIGKTRDGLKTIFNGLDNFGRQIFGKKWSKIKDVMAAPIRGARDAIKIILDKLRGTMSGAMTAIGKVWSRFANPVQSAIRGVINTVNQKLIKGGINWILTKLQVPKDKQVPWIPAPKFRDGGSLGPLRQLGRIRGRGGPRQDLQPLLGSPGEFMQPEKAVSFYGVQGMERIRRRQVPKEALLEPMPVQRLAGGGLVGGSGSWTPEATRALTAASQRAGVNFSVFQRGFRPTTPYSGTSHQRDAIDTGPVIPKVWMALRELGWAAWDRTGKGNWAPHIHAVPLAGKGVGSPGGSGVWQGSDYLSGGDGLGGRDYHSYRPGTSKIGQLLKGIGGAIGSIAGGIGGAIGGALDFLGGADPVKWLTDKVAKVTAGPGVLANALAFGVPKMIIGKAKDWIAEKIGIGGDVSGATWSGGKVGNWAGDQLNNAATIIKVARSLGFGDRGATIGLMTAMQESTLRNISYGDRDSVGLFQQRAPWGSFADRTNPAKSAAMFFNGGQGGQPGLRSKDWRTLPLGVAAQQVQVSAFPDAYNKWQGQAAALVQKFDTGGKLRPGLTLAYNGTGKSETIRTAEQEARLGGGRPIEVTINLNGPADKLAYAREIRRALTDLDRVTGVKITAGGR